MAEMEIFDWKFYCALGVAIIAIGLWFARPVVNPEVAGLLILLGVFLAIGAPTYHFYFAPRAVESTVRLKFENIERRPYWSADPGDRKGIAFMQFTYRVGVINETTLPVAVQVVLERYSAHRGFANERLERRLRTSHDPQADTAMVPPSDGEPTVFFDVAEEWIAFGQDRTDWAYLCTTGDANDKTLPWGHSTLTLRLQGGAKPHRIKLGVEKRKPGTEALDGSVTDVVLTKLTVKRVSQ